MLAILLLSWAEVRSATMQFEMLTVAATAMASDDEMADCGAMDRAMPAMDRPAVPAGHPHQKATCPLCAVAAQLALPALPVPFAYRWLIQRVAYRQDRPNLPRGPPAAEPRARDPPSRSQSL